MKRKLTPEEQDEEDALRRKEEAEARAQGPVSRQELQYAIEYVAQQYACRGDHDGDLICEAFRQLAEILA